MIMSAKIYVENIVPATTENELKDSFSTYGNVAEVDIVLDRTHQKPRGFGFVTMVTPEGARAALEALQGRRIREQTLTVREAGPVKQDASLAKPPFKGVS